MLEIDVFFGLESVKPAPNQKPLSPVVVNPDPAAAHSGDDIIWHFHSLNDDVDSVEVDFADDTDQYFECRDKPEDKAKKCHTKLHGYDHHSSEDKAAGKPKGGKHGHLLGTSPSLGYGVKASKYTIKAFDASGTKLYELDPIVVTCDP